MIEDLTKFPVVSRSGKEYMINISRTRGGGLVKVQINKYIGKSKILRKDKFDYLRTETYRPEDYNYNYVEIAKNAVEYHELRIETLRRECEQMKQEALERMLKQQDGIEAFKNWSGKC
ncbi:hypothetical protein WKH56_19690 [Priestia sp. SB1]|uniref:hypothetical protein n=1 Tax=Priestia sp. SB1 TaxID=3132359 RepID=UPI00316CE6B6